MKRSLDKVRVFAHELHHGQVRKGSGEPYITHPRAVAYLVNRYHLNPLSPEQQDECDDPGADTENHQYNFVVMAACWLHDTMEDCDVTAEQIVDRLVADKACSPNEAILVTELVHQLTSLDKLGPESVSEQKRAMRKSLMRDRLFYMSPAAQIIKACDRLDNTKSMKDLSPGFRCIYAEESIALFDAFSWAAYSVPALHRLLEAIRERCYELKNVIEAVNLGGD